ncbi:glycosyltransferase family 2 protein [Tabrizicola sp. KVB23]|uniref:Glycosyltransferase family 2 protein n=2 Tax=Fuscibacter oryzae TaxID=2803939 RepID=A0A8J7SUH6_9RHOB|nr:glycosyltransferase family 2 protein [Fuscibacter oryzae]
MVPDGPAIAVLMATYNGAAHLAEQLDSIAGQTLPPRWLVVSDDGSSDATLAIVAGFASQRRGITVTVLRGPGQGAAANFLHLLAHVPAGADFAALSDQDDVWLPAKLADGVALLAATNLPTLLGARTLVCDENLQAAHPSPLWRRPFGFGHALVQSFAGGNTMMLNRGAIALAAEAATEAGQVVMHDWWLYQIIAGAGGRVVFDARPQLYYRQHGANQIGANRGPIAKLHRLRVLLRGDFRRWNGINLRALRASAHRLTPENRAILQGFAQLRDLPLWRRIAQFRRLGLYRQGPAGTVSLWLAVALGRL